MRAIAERSLSERSGRPVEVMDDGRFALGDAGACAETIAAYREVGVEHFVINLACPVSDVPAQVRTIRARRAGAVPLTGAADRRLRVRRAVRPRKRGVTQGSLASPICGDC